MTRPVLTLLALISVPGCTGGASAGKDSGTSWVDTGGSVGGETGTSDSTGGEGNSSDSTEDTTVETGREDTGRLDSSTSEPDSDSDTGSSFDAMVTGSGGDRGFGEVTAAAGDVNGDGNSDVWIGNELADPQAAYLFQGPVPPHITSEDASVRVLSSTGALYTRAYPLLTQAGDVDADGFGDVLFGAPDAGDSYVGVALLLLGPGAGDVYLEDADGFIWGEEEESGTGGSLAGPGDINGDGWDDLMIGNPRATASGASSDEGACPDSEEDEPGEADGAQAGVTWLFFGPVTGSVLVSEADASLTGEDGYDKSGGSVQGAGDLDGDGLPDLLVSASNQCELTEGGGAAYVVLSPVSGSVSLADADGKIGAFDTQYIVGSADDVDGDGTPDIVWKGMDGTSREPSVFIFSGPALGDRLLSDALAQVDRGPTAENVSYVIDPIGDLDADGFADLLFLDPRDDDGGHSAGAGYILRGPISGVHDLSEADLKITGPAAGDVLGVDGAGLGDTNGDGLPDIVLGAPGDETMGPDAGAAYLLLGGGSILGAL